MNLFDFQKAQAQSKRKSPNIPPGKRLYLGCTLYRAQELGIDAVINARGGRLDLNDWTQEDTELQRDARAIRDRLERRVRWYGPNSRFFRRHRARIEHLIADRSDW